MVVLRMQSTSQIRVFLEICKCNPFKTKLTEKKCKHIPWDVLIFFCKNFKDEYFILLVYVLVQLQFLTELVLPQYIRDVTV